jgi:hypothetical protein
VAARYATDTFVMALTLAPPSGLAAAAVGSGGTFAAATYFWKVTGTNAAGETTGSNEATVAIVLNGSCNLTWSALPSGTTGVKVYRGTVTNTENALIVTLGAVTSYTDTGTAGSAATPPAANSALTASHLVQKGSLRDSTHPAVVSYGSLFTSAAPVTGKDVTGVIAGRLAVYPAGTEF